MPAKRQPTRGSAPPWSARRRWVVSALVAFHLSAVFLPPFAFETSPVRGLGSPAAEAMLRLVQPYVDFCYLNHGYAFFAPNPGPSHLLRAELQFADGRPPRTVTLPDLESHWPRLLYHRHFMLSEHLHGSFVPPDVPREIAEDPAEVRQWQAARAFYERRWEAVREHLRHRYGAARVELRRVEHRLLSPYEAAAGGMRPDDPSTYVELSETAATEEEMP